jgi:hypothetical protein
MGITITTLSSTWYSAFSTWSQTELVSDLLSLPPWFLFCSIPWKYFPLLYLWYSFCFSCTSPWILKNIIWATLFRLQLLLGHSHWLEVIISSKELWGHFLCLIFKLKISSENSQIFLKIWLMELSFTSRSINNQ